MLYFNLSNCFKDYQTCIKEAFKYEAHGRFMCGVAVFVHKALNNVVKFIDSDSKFCIFLKLDKSLFGKSKDGLLFVCYLPPVDSPAYRHERYKRIELLEYQLSELDINLCDFD